MSYSYSYNPEVWPALITLALAIYLGSYGWRQRKLPAAKSFTAACIFGGFWTLGVILELSALDFSTQVFWVKFQAIWHLPTATLIACFILHYAGLSRWLTRRTYALLFIIPLLSVLFILTNDLHHLIWTGFQIDRYVVVSPGRLYWFFNSYIYLLGLLNITVLIWLAIHAPGQRLPVAIIVFCQICVRIVFATDKLDIALIGPGESVLLMIGVMAVAYAVVLLKFHAIDPVGAARKASLQQMREGFIVLDVQGRVADANPMAARMLGLSESHMLSNRLEDMLPKEAAGEFKQIAHNETGQTDITMGNENPARQYRLNVTELRGRQGEVIGKLILLHDVTEQIRAQTRIINQQSMVATLQERERLARELHDGIAQTLAYVGMQTQSVMKWLHEGNPEQAGSLLGRLLEVAKDAQTSVRESILNLKTSKDQQWSFIKALKEYIQKFQENYGMHIELSHFAGIEGNTFDQQKGVQLLRVIQEALTNAGKHSRANTLRICIERDGSMANISITDDGQGFDARQFEHGDDGHFGLVFMRERMVQIGGSLTIVSKPGRGTQLTLNVPVVSFASGKSDISFGPKRPKNVLPD